MEEETTKDHQTGSDIPASGDVTTKTLEAQLEELISNALGDKLTLGQKAKLHTVGTVASTVVGILLPLAKDKIDVPILLDGLADVNQGILLQENGIKKIISSKKEAA